MTRVAPRSSPSIHASQSLLEVRWRVGVRGSLTLAVLQGAHAEAAIAVVVLGSERFVLEGTVEDSGREVHFAFFADSDHSPTSATVAPVVMPENPSDTGSQSLLVAFRVDLCPNPSVSESGRILLTDLPTRLGLLGGTYVLESIRAGF